MLPVHADSIMVDSWEVEQRQYTRTLFVLQRVERELGALFGEGQAPEPAEVSELGCCGFSSCGGAGI